MLQDLALDVILRILSSLEREDLRRVGQCSRLMRLLANQSLLSRNIVICAQSQHEKWVRESCYFDMSRMDLEPVRYGDNNDEEDFLMDMYDEPYVFTKEETLTYVKILQGFHGEPQPEAVEKHIRVSSDSSSVGKLDCRVNSMRATSPTSSDYSKSSANSVFSDGPPRLSNNEWSSPIHELDHLSDQLGSEASDCESSSSSDSIAKLRSSTKVKDKAALFEKLIMKDSRRKMESQRNTGKKKSYGTLSNLFKESKLDAANKRKVSQGYIEELARCNGESESSLRDLMNSHKQDVEVEHTNEELSKRHRKHKRVSRNRLKAFVTQGNKVSYEKI